MSIICTICTYKNIDGTFYCEECGTRLDEKTSIDTHKFEKGSINIDTEENSQKITPPLSFSHVFASLHIVSTGQILPLVGKTEFTIGRISSGQPVLPDIDLSPYQAYKQGVSRLHSSIKIVKNKAYLYDMNSANGVYVNKEKIIPATNHELHHGDIITLGQFKLQILLNQ